MKPETLHDQRSLKTMREPGFLTRLCLAQLYDESLATTIIPWQKACRRRLISRLTLSTAARDISLPELIT